MTRRSPLARACSSANFSDVSVLPPPVGTVSVKRPGGIGAFEVACRSTAARARFTLPFGSPKRARRLSSAARWSSLDFSAALHFLALGVGVETLRGDEVGIDEAGEEHSNVELLCEALLVAR